MGRDVQNLSSGFPTRPDSNQSPWQQRLARKLNFTCSKLRYDTFQKAINTGTDQSVRMHRLVCAFVVANNEDKFSRIEVHTTQIKILVSLLKWFC